MKKCGILGILCFCVVVSFTASAGEKQERQQGTLHMDAARDRLALSVAGQEKEGFLEFFVDKDVSSRHVTQDVSASDLNAISPAAGVQFRLEF